MTQETDAIKAQSTVGAGPVNDTHGEHLLYGYPGSGSAAIEAALRLARLPHRVVQAASWDAASELQALREASPLVQVPALRWPDGSVMSESAAILVELGLRHPDSGLLPPAPTARARSLHGLAYLGANCYAAIGIIDYPERWTRDSEDRAREKLRQGARDRLHALWERFADTFEPAPFLAGDRLGGLDLLAAVVSKWSGARAHLRHSRPQWAAVLERIEADPVVAEVFARHWPQQAA